MEGDRIIGAEDMGLMVAMALCDILEAKGVLSMSEVADTLDAMAALPENQPAAKIMQRLAARLRPAQRNVERSVQ
jgi:hypothetical protein